MQRRTSTMCWLIISAGLVLASALPAKAAETTLQGTWIASKAEQDGKAADDLVGHRLSFMGNRFEIRGCEVRDETNSDWIGTDGKNDWDCLSRRLGS